MDVSKVLNKVDFNTVLKVSFVGISLLLIYRIAKRTKQNIDIYTVDASNATLSNVQIAGLANKIAQAWGGIWNDNEQAVYDAFSALGNYDDLIKLMRAYSYKNENLQQSITRRMSNREVAKINSILASKGINYKF